LIPAGKGWIAIAGEGGHATMAPADDRESAVLERMRRHFDHVSAERVLSGPGLVNLYNALTMLDAVPSRGYTAAQITDPAIGADPLRRRPSLFCNAQHDGRKFGADPGPRRRLYRRWDRAARPEGCPNHSSLR
jgi:glucokinase